MQGNRKKALLFASELTDLISGPSAREGKFRVPKGREVSIASTIERLSQIVDVR